MGKLSRTEFEAHYLIDPQTIAAFREVEPWAILNNKHESYHLRLSNNGISFLSNLDTVTVYSCEIPIQKWQYSNLYTIISVMQAPYYIEDNFMHNKITPVKLYMLDEQQFMLLQLCDKNVDRLKALTVAK